MKENDSSETEQNAPLKQNKLLLHTHAASTLGHCRNPGTHMKEIYLTMLCELDSFYS